MPQNNSNDKPAPKPRQSWVNTQIVRSIAPTPEERTNREASANSVGRTPDAKKGNQ